jgi:hypothetical protein
VTSASPEPAESFWLRETAGGRVGWQFRERMGLDDDPEMGPWPHSPRSACTPRSTSTAR